MKKKKKVKRILIFILIFSFLYVDVAYASISENLKFNNITINDGLSQSTVEALYQDSRGYIWIGTNNGLNRLSGNGMKYYKNDKYDKSSLANNYIIDITEDNDSYMWISTLRGISRINLDNDEIKNYYKDENEGNLSNNTLCQILATSDDKLLAATVDGLNLYDKEKDKFFRILEGENELPSQYIYSVKEDSRGHIWIGTDNGLVQLDKGLNKLKSYDDTIGKIDAYNIYDDSKGNIWVTTLGNGLFRIHLEDESITNYKKSDDEYSIASNVVRDVMTDDKGILWVSTDEGICSFDYQKNIFVNYDKDTSASDDLLDIKTRCLLKDRSGLIWVGSFGGISVLNPNSSFYHFKANASSENSLNSNFITGMSKDEDDILWVGTSENGVNIIIGDEVKYLDEQNSNLISNSIHDLVVYNNKIYIGTNEGLSVVEKRENGSYDITNYTKDDGLPSERIRSLFVDSKGYLWIGTNKGIACLDTSNGQVTDISYIFNKIGVNDKFIRAVYEDSKGNYYIGCFLDGGLIKVNPQTKEFKIYTNDKNDTQSISSNSIRYISEDLDGNILVGTSHGINILDPNTDKLKHYTESDGLINNTIYGILVDENNNIWMSTNGGIAKFSLQTEKFKNYTVKDGLQSNEFNGRSCFKDKKGNLYFGGINGFNVINSNNIELSAFKPKIIFDSVEVNGIVQQDISSTKLRYNENNIKVNFFSDEYINDENNKFYYRLSGQENDWKAVDGKTLTFAKLVPGNYNLEVKTISKHGIESEISSLKFIIKPPIWKSNLAKIMFCIGIIIIAYVYANKVSTLDKLVNIKTIELRKQIEKNEKLFDQILELEQSKNNYFVNLSHELRTPLNIITSINQLIKSYIKENKTISNEKLDHYMDVINRNSKRLVTLINNIIDYEKLENDSYVITKQNADIVYLVEETVLEMKDYIEEKGIKLIFDTDVEEKSIQCDKLDIERCVINLVSNAVKFTPSGGIIEVVVEDLNKKVKISVRDNGIGISKENQKIIFNRFNQGRGKNCQRKDSSGLGLTITKQILNLHGGEIYVKSEEGVGSEFVMILPSK